MSLIWALEMEGTREYPCLEWTIFSPTGTRHPPTFKQQLFSFGDPSGISLFASPSPASPPPHKIKPAYEDDLLRPVPHAANMLPGADISSELLDICTDDCVPPWAKEEKENSAVHQLLSSSVFFVTFCIIFFTVLQRLFPVLCGAGARHLSHLENRGRKRVAALTFSTTLGATGVLAELILCEVSEWGNATSRRLGFPIVVGVLLVCLVVITPLLELHSLIEGSGITNWRRQYVIMVEMAAFAGWLWIFWYLGDQLPIRKASRGPSRTLMEECLARVGVIGVSLMALLSGFGCVSSPWHNFTSKPRPVTDIDISRAQAGLAAAIEMLEEKRKRLRILDTKIQEKRSSQEGFMSKVLFAVRGDSDVQEQSVLLSEISGLETMGNSLSVELADLQRRITVQKQSKSAFGRLLRTISYGFSVYCLYRIFATSLAHIPYLHRSRSSFSQSDPINNVVALLAQHWDPHLDRAAWSRMIGFAFSGVIITGSLGSVMTTLNMLSRAAPGVISHATKSDNPNLALFVSQISAVYMLASALLLRSNLPSHMSFVISDALGAPLDPAFVDRWFDALFLGAASLTIAALVVGRKIGWWGARKDDIFGDDLMDLEAGKMS